MSDKEIKNRLNGAINLLKPITDKTIDKEDKECYTVEEIKKCIDTLFMLKENL